MEGLGPANISGIISGLDTASIVNAIIASERGNARLLELRQAEKTNMISAYRALEGKLLAIQSRLTGLARSTTFTKG